MSIIWPWAEDNRGALSLLMSGIALYFAVSGYIRSLNEGKRRRRAFVDLLIAMLDGVIAAGDKCIVDAGGGGFLGTHAQPYLAAQARALETIGVIWPSMPSDAQLAVAVGATRVDVGSSWNWPTEGIRPLAGQLAKLREHRRTLVNLRPN